MVLKTLKNCVKSTQNQNNKKLNYIKVVKSVLEIIKNLVPF